MTRSPATSAGSIRPFQHEDAAAVAMLLQFLLPGGAVGVELAAYLQHYYLDGPFASAECPALVYVSEQGNIDGFGGRVIQPFALGDKILHAAVVGALIVRDHARAPTAGARLLKALKSGPQDLTLSETAGDAALKMWRQLNGDVLERHSLDFIRVLQPAQYALDLLASRMRIAKLLSPLAAIGDRMLATGKGSIRWTGIPDDFKPERGVHARPIDFDAFVAQVHELTKDDHIVPQWPRDCLPQVVAEAACKRVYGEPHMGAAVTPAGKVIGVWLFHFSGRGPVRVTDVFHSRGQAGLVLDALFTDAHALGASCVTGRTTPQLFDALLSRRAVFAHTAASVIAADDPKLLEAFSNGLAHFNGLVGERWTRLIGDRFD